MVTEVACGNNSSGPEWTAGARRVKVANSLYLPLSLSVQETVGVNETAVVATVFSVKGVAMYS